MRVEILSNGEVRFELVPETQTEEHFLSNLDRDNLAVWFDQNRLSLYFQIQYPEPVACAKVR